MTCVENGGCTQIVVRYHKADQIYETAPKRHKQTNAIRLTLHFLKMAGEPNSKRLRIGHAPHM